jgi:heme/copper-type cytochrome/quinol oxidase subunit 2
MKRAMRWVVPVAGAAAVVVLFLLLRPDDEPSPAATASPVTTATPAPTATSGPTMTETGSATPSPTETPGREGARIEIEVSGGVVSGPGEVEVPQGSRVEIEVEADVSDEVHVHGYDLLADVTPDRRARIAFRATATGVFEVELEGAGLLLLRLRVVP